MDSAEYTRGAMQTLATLGLSKSVGSPTQLRGFLGSLVNGCRAHGGGESSLRR